jgi:TPR repeat protein
MRKLTISLQVAGLLLLAGCASPNGAVIEATFNSGVAAYDAHDYARAYQIWSSIQDQDLAALRNMAMMQRDGTGMPKDPKKAEALYQRAAEAGNPYAQADLGEMLLKGAAGPPDVRAALPLLAAASAANHPVAEFELGELYETGVPDFLPKDLNTARKLYTAAAGHGMKEAQARLAMVGPAPDGAAATSIPAAQPTSAASPAATPPPR